MTSDMQFRIEEYSKYRIALRPSPHFHDPVAPVSLQWHLVSSRPQTTSHKHAFIMALSYPPGGSFFDTIKKNFTDVPVDAANGNAINTTDFLQAAESLTGLFGKTRPTVSRKLLG